MKMLCFILLIPFFNGCSYTNSGKNSNENLPPVPEVVDKNEKKTVFFISPLSQKIKYVWI
jgi:hypothetical protein